MIDFIKNTTASIAGKKFADALLGNKETFFGGIAYDQQRGIQAASVETALAETAVSVGAGLVMAGVSAVAAWAFPEAVPAVQAAPASTQTHTRV